MSLPEVPCQIPQLSLGCFGCCGRLYESREEVLLGIRKNTLTWRDEQEKPEGQRLSLRAFCWRQKPLRPCGVCVNVVEEEGKFFCVVHPKRHGGQEVREGYCNTNFLCAAAKEFQEMNGIEKEQYVLFLQEKIVEGMNSYEYSMLNDKDALIKEFKELFLRREK